MEFEDAVEIILKHEGGYVNNPKDPGGETNFGISKRSYPDLDIKNLTIEEAKNIYRSDYWNRIHGDDIPEKIRLLVFDCAVNQGAYLAMRLLQECVNVLPDGLFGTRTMDAVWDVDQEEFILKYAQMRLREYTKIKNWDYYGVGWSKRLLDISMRCALS